jgi:hypothetical protein
LNLIENWDKYPNDTTRYELWREHNLVVKSINIAKKYFTLANHLRTQLQCLVVLKTWLLQGDGSRMKRGHLDCAEFKELTDCDAAKVLESYSQTKTER